MRKCKASGPGRVIVSNDQLLVLPHLPSSPGLPHTLFQVMLIHLLALCSGAQHSVATHVSWNTMFWDTVPVALYSVAAYPGTHYTVALYPMAFLPAPLLSIWIVCHHSLRHFILSTMS